MLNGAAVGARLAVGPQRWRELRPFFFVVEMVANVTASLLLLGWLYLLVRAVIDAGFVSRFFM